MTVYKAVLTLEAVITVEAATAEEAIEGIERYGNSLDPDDLEIAVYNDGEESLVKILNCDLYVGCVETPTKVES